MILPIHDSGQSNAAADFDMFTDEERQLWTRQLNVGIARQLAGLDMAPNVVSAPPANVTYNVSGSNVRVNINSNDNSVNIVSSVPAELFQQMLDALRAAAAESPARIKVERSIQEMASNYGSAGFGNSYRTFISMLADHIQVFGPILAPYLPALANFVT